MAKKKKMIPPSYSSQLVGPPRNKINNRRRVTQIETFEIRFIFQKGCLVQQSRFICHCLWHELFNQFIIYQRWIYFGHYGQFYLWKPLPSRLAMNMNRRFVLYGYMQSFCLIFSSLVTGMKLDGFFLRVGQFFSVIPVKNSDILRITCIYSSKNNYNSFYFYVLVKTITFWHTVKYKINNRRF